MKSFLMILFAVAILVSPFAKAEENGCSDVYSSLVFEENSGDILFEKRAESFSYPASLVKLMTLYLTFEAIEKHKLSPEQILTISEYGQEISHVNKINSLFLKEGDKISTEEAVQGVIVKSFNEAAVALAEAVANNEWEFVQMMNKKALELGMINSSFRNSSGLHEEGQYSTSYDLALLSQAIKRDFPGYYYLFALKEFTFAGAKYQTHNHVLLDYEGSEGLKTGFTKAAGFNLIAAAKKKNSRVISVLLGCSSHQKRDEFTKSLLDESFAKIAKSQDSKIHFKKIESFNYAEGDENNDYLERVRFGMSLLNE